MGCTALRVRWGGGRCAWGARVPAAALRVRPSNHARALATPRRCRWGDQAENKMDEVLLAGRKHHPFNANHPAWGALMHDMFPNKEQVRCYTIERGTMNSGVLVRARRRGVRAQALTACIVACEYAAQEVSGAELGGGGGGAWQCCRWVEGGHEGRACVCRCRGVAEGACGPELCVCYCRGPCVRLSSHVWAAPHVAGGRKDLGVAAAWWWRWPMNVLNVVAAPLGHSCKSRPPSRKLEQS